MVFFWYLYPYLIIFSLPSSDPIVDVCFDSSRNWLYTLSASSAISLYDLDEGMCIYAIVVTVQCCICFFFFSASGECMRDYEYIDYV